MTPFGWLQIVVYFAILILMVKPLGSFIAKVFEGQRTILTPVFKPVEKILYRLAGVDPSVEMGWKEYTIAMLLFNFIGIVFLYILIQIQGSLPFDPSAFGGMPFHSALNVAISFVTNTNWQNYAGESSLSYFTQMMGMTVQNFLSAATGMAILAAFIRGFSRHTAKTLGNFWVDLTRSILYVLLPLSIILALILVSQGVVQTLAPSIQAHLIQPFTASNGQVITDQTISVGPVASQVAIKHIGTNGGGFFNANAAHPFENPTPFTNLLLMLSETIIPAALTYTFGKMVGDTKQGWSILIAMILLLVIFTGISYSAESAINPDLSKLGIDMTTSDLQPGGNMEGKEVRFGIAPSALFATITTATSTGAVNSMHDSFSPIGGFIQLLMMQLGEVLLGGVGSGLYGILIFVIIAVFIAGLMVGRTPEYLGKKIEPFEMKMAAILILLMPVIVLGLTAIAVSLPSGVAGISNPGPHGFSQILYAFSSEGNNNGSAFAGLSANTPFYNYTGAFAMLIARFLSAILTLALAGSFVTKKKSSPGAGTLSTTSFLFIGWLIVVILMVGALNFLPALALGPIVEHLMLFGIK